MTGKTKAAMPGRLSHNALLKHRQITRLAAGGQTLRRRNSCAQINSVCLTYGHRNPLRSFQTANMQSAQKTHSSLIRLNYRETRQLANSLNRLDYNESLESANSLITPFPPQISETLSDIF